MNNKHFSQFNSFDIIEGMVKFAGLSMDCLDMDDYIVMLDSALKNCPGLTSDIKYLKALVECIDSDSFDKEYDEMLDTYENFDTVIDVLSDIYNHIWNS